MTQTGVINTGTLKGNTASTVNLSGNNTIANLGAFTSNGTLTINDTTGGLNVTGAVSTTNTGLARITTTGGSLAVTTGTVAGAGVTLTTTGAADITLAGNVNGNAGTVTLNSGQAISQTAGVISTSGALSINAGGAVSQTAGSMTVGGTTSINAGANDVTLANSANDFGGTVTVTGRNVSLTDSNDLTAVLTASGNSTLVAAGNLTVGGSAASLALAYGQGAPAAGNNSDYIVSDKVDLPAGPNFSTKLGSDGTVTNYTVITSLGAEGSTTGADLQGMNGGLGLNYALGSNVIATSTSTWNAGAGFTSIGTAATPFTGTFDGLGHTISNLTIISLWTDYTGLFGYASATSQIRNVGLLGGSVTGFNFVGGLAGENDGTISNSYSTASVSASASYSGGLVAFNSGTINNSYATGPVSGADNVGGLVGNNSGTVSNSYSSGSVTGVNNSLGGLVGISEGAVNNSHYNVETVTINGNHVPYRRLCEHSVSRRRFRCRLLPDQGHCGTERPAGIFRQCVVQISTEQNDRPYQCSGALHPEFCRGRV